MKAPTVWEEGRWSGARITRFSLFASALLIVTDVTATGHLDRIFDSGLIVLCIWNALAIRPGDFFRVGVLPPILVLGSSLLLSVFDRGAIANGTDGQIQAIITALARHSGPLLIAQGLTLALLATRQRVLRRHGRSTESHVWVDRSDAYSNLDGSPAPYLVISGAPEVKSTTVVGNEPQSPESITASSS